MPATGRRPIAVLLLALLAPQLIAAESGSTSPRRRAPPSSPRRRDIPSSPRRRSPVPPPSSPRRRSPVPPPCLCVFDLDRTLTGKQNDTHHCSNNKVIHHIHDPAFGGGPLTLSQGALNLDQTFCKQCYVGVISAGHAGGDRSEMRDELILYLNRNKMHHLKVDNIWNEPKNDKVKAPLVVGVPNGHKHHVASGIRDWYTNVKKVHITTVNTHFFDDEAANIAQFNVDHGYQARQISCKSRDNTKDDKIGYCGMTVDEVSSASGIAFCSKEVPAWVNITAGLDPPSPTVIV